MKSRMSLLIQYIGHGQCTLLENGILTVFCTQVLVRRWGIVLHMLRCLHTCSLDIGGAGGN